MQSSALTCLARLAPVLILMGGCAANQITLRGTPTAVMAEAKTRFLERQIALDPKGEGPRRLRTAFFCHKELDPVKGGWDRSFTTQRAAPLEFTHIGSVHSQDQKQNECRYIHRVRLDARATEAGSMVDVTAQWWRLQPGKCQQDGDPLSGIIKCTYRYVPTHPKDDVRPFILGMLEGL